MTALLARRTLLAGVAAALVAAPAILPSIARAQGRYARAAAYSAEHRGISMLVMRGGRIEFEDYPKAAPPTDRTRPRAGPRASAASWPLPPSRTGC
jgi:hypothetical protein